MKQTLKKSIVLTVLITICFILMAAFVTDETFAASKTRLTKNQKDIGEMVAFVMNSFENKNMNPYDFNILSAQSGNWGDKYTTHLSISYWDSKGKFQRKNYYYSSATGEMALAGNKMISGEVNCSYSKKTRKKIMSYAAELAKLPFTEEEYQIMQIIKQHCPTVAGAGKKGKQEYANSIEISKLEYGDFKLGTTFDDSTRTCKYKVQIKYTYHNKMGELVSWRAATFCAWNKASSSSEYRLKSFGNGKYEIISSKVEKKYSQKKRREMSNTVKQWIEAGI